MEKSVSTGLKVWLWVIIVFNGISVLGSLGSIASAPLQTIISIVLNAGMIAAGMLIMFKMKKAGFKIMVAVAAVNAVKAVILAILAGTVAGVATGSASVGLAGGIMAAVIAVVIAAICPLVTYALMKKDWDMFD